ncbi:hypothetical protein [Tomitella gaofuii]|nr:hypothetical protein [Tomitella gaofuii]
MGSVSDIFGNLTTALQGFIDEGLGSVEGVLGVVTSSLGGGQQG